MPLADCNLLAAADCFVNHKPDDAQEDKCVYVIAAQGLWYGRIGMHGGQRQLCLSHPSSL